MTPEEKFKRAVRYLSVGGDQVLQGQINQPAQRQNPKKLPGQRVMFWVALVAVVAGFVVGIWALLQ